MPNLLSVSEVARRLGAKPRDISDLFYQRLLRDDLCPIVAGRRLVPEDYLGMVRTTLRSNGRQVDELVGAQTMPAVGPHIIVHFLTDQAAQAVREVAARLHITVGELVLDALAQSHPELALDRTETEQRRATADFKASRAKSDLNGAGDA